MNDCIFCKIINNEIPSKTIYEDDLVKVFLDVNPDSVGHTLIVPKKHFLDINDIDEVTLNHINKISKDISKLLKDKLNYDGLKLIQNNGVIQEIKHYHLHLIPIYLHNKNIDLDEVYNNLK